MNARKASAIRRKHRSIGALAAVFILFMVLSGMLINHAGDLDLDQRHVSNPHLLELYGIDTPDIRSFRLDDDWLSFAGSGLYFNELDLTTITGGIGAVDNGLWIVAAGRDALVLIDQQGQLVERMTWHQPNEIESIGLTADGRIAVTSGNGLWLANEDLLAWKQADDDRETVQWASAEPAPKTLQHSITRHYRGGGLSMERVLLDLHSGRIFGPIGILVYDLLALAIAFLALSGLALWFRNRRNGKTR